MKHAPAVSQGALGGRAGVGGRTRSAEAGRSKHTQREGANEVAIAPAASVDVLARGAPNELLWREGTGPRLRGGGGAS